VPLEELTHAGCTQDPDYESFAVDGYCTQYLRCDDVGYVASSCSSNDDDDKTVSCDCDSANGPHYHLLVDQLDGIATCDRVTEMCRQETPVQFHGGYDCKLTVHDSGPLDCEIAKHCRREEQQPNDLIALEIGNPDTRCLTGAAIPDAPIGADPLAPGDFAKCDCDANSSIELADTPMDEVCEIAQNVCFFGMLPTSTGEASCEPDADALDSAADHCHAAQRCKQPSAIGDASAAISAEYSVDCAPAQNGSEWSCSCDDGARTSSYSVSPSAASADTCAAALAQCQTSLTVVPTSELSCKVVENSIDRSVSEMCTQTVVCTASGVSGDLTVTRQGRASMRCWPEGGAPSCYCDAQGHETYEYNFESDLSVEELCGHEISACADRIDFNAPLVQPAQPR
jgi:hypothetical protein